MCNGNYGCDGNHGTRIRKAIKTASRASQILR
jgi:hypothetical protein